MGRRTTRAMTPAERVATVLTVVLCVGLTAVAALALAGVVPVTGSGEGTLPGQLIFGGLFAVVGLGGMVAGVRQLLAGRVTVEPPPPPVDPDDPSSDPFHSSGLGHYAPGGRQPPASGEF